MSAATYDAVPQDSTPFGIGTETCLSMPGLTEDWPADESSGAGLGVPATFVPEMTPVAVDVAATVFVQESLARTGAAFE